MIYFKVHMNSIMKVEMQNLVKVKGLKGKQNKKKWAKNIDVSGLLQARNQLHTQQVRDKNASAIMVEDDNDKVRPALNPDRFKKVVMPAPKTKYNNKVVRNLKLDEVDDTWNSTFEGKHKYKPTEVPAVIIPESGHSYNPRDSDVEKLKDRVIDYEEHRPIARKVKREQALPGVQVRHRNRNRRIDQLAAVARVEQKEINRELNNMKNIRNELESKEKKVEQKLKTKQIVKDRLKAQNLAGRVRKGPKLSKKVYRFKEYVPEKEAMVEQLSKVELKDEAFRDRFDSIYRRGVFQPRNIKIHANKRKNIKVIHRAFIE